MDLSHLKDLLLIALAACISKWVGAQLAQLVKSVESLNVSMALVLDKLTFHHSRILDHDERICEIENKCRVTHDRLKIQGNF